MKLPCAAFVLFVILPPCLATAAELRHFWDFEAGFADQAGEAHGIVSDSTTVQLVPGHDAGQAILTGNLAGIPDDVVLLEEGALRDPGTGAFSVSFWFRIADDGTADTRGIFDFSGNGRDGMHALYIGASGNLAVRVDGPPATNTSNNSLVLVPMDEDDLWHFVAATYDPDNGLAVYVDGPEADGTAGPLAAGGFIPFEDVAYLGAFNLGAAQELKGLNGALDDMAVYAGVLTPEEIGGLFTGAITPRTFPREVLPVPEITGITRDPGSGECTVTWTTAAGFSYDVWGSPDLINWERLTETSVSGTGDPQVFSYIADPTAYYFRVSRQ